MAFEDDIYYAKLAEAAERFDDMVHHVTKFAKGLDELDVEQRNLLSVAYKNQIGNQRTSWRILSSIEQREASSDEKSVTASTATGTSILEAARQYRLEIEKELREACNVVLQLIDEHLLPHATKGESKVFFHKMKGDYLRYRAESAIGSERKDAAENSLTAYKTASDVAMSELPTTDPVRLGLALNFSVFYYEILNSPERACRLAKAAFDDAVADLTSSSSTDPKFKDSTLIMQLLKDNLTLWTTEPEGDGKEDEKDDAGEVGAAAGAL